jgi:NAD+ diphosphatase
LTFQLDDLPVLSRSTVGRDDPLRDDDQRQRTLWPASRVLLVDRHGRFAIHPDRPDGLVFTPASELGESIVDGSVLLGEQDGTGYWAAPVDEGGQGWTDLRRCGAALDATAAGLAVTAVAVLGWHRRAPYCSGCGRPTSLARAGWARRCHHCDREEYPRTDPAVICLVHDGADHVLVARALDWPPGRFSVLAGFVEAGESLEACVVREIAEEVGIDVRDVRYLGSQPWPFPRSLMIGFAARADRDQPLKPGDREIAEARWVHRNQVRDALAAGSWADRTGPVHGQHPELVLPGQVSIAGQMLTAWAGSGPTLV